MICVAPASSEEDRMLMDEGIIAAADASTLLLIAAVWVNPAASHASQPGAPGTHPGPARRSGVQVPE
jgi:hypothetical protein